jgi:hypothetical protein
LSGRRESVDRSSRAKGCEADRANVTGTAICFTRSQGRESSRSKALWAHEPHDLNGSCGDGVLAVRDVGSPGESRAARREREEGASREHPHRDRERQRSGRRVRLPQPRGAGGHASQRGASPWVRARPSEERLPRASPDAPRPKLPRRKTVASTGRNGSANCTPSGRKPTLRGDAAPGRKPDAEARIGRGTAHADPRRKTPRRGGLPDPPASKWNVPSRGRAVRAAVPLDGCHGFLPWQLRPRKRRVELEGAVPPRALRGPTATHLVGSETPCAFRLREPSPTSRPLTLSVALRVLPRGSSPRARAAPPRLSSGDPASRTARTSSRRNRLELRRS